MGSSKRILITGGSGLVGTRLTEILHAKGHEVVHLGRTKSDSGVRSFVWDVEKQTMDTSAFDGVSAIIHLAGAGVADKRWSRRRKKVIMESRRQSASLLHRELNRHRHSVDTFISASAIGYYGPGDDQTIFRENDPPGGDFLSEVSREWEIAADQFTDLGVRVVKIRIGIVLSGKGGALEPLEKTVRLGAGSPLGSGEQWMSWIHIDDLCAIFAAAIENENMRGVYNAVAPFPVKNREFVRELAAVLKKPLILPRVPPVVLRVLFGEMSTIVLDGAKVSSDKIRQEGFTFSFPKLREALMSLLRPV